jgi:predicted RNase H-like nuclease (RuvC/YqgF family)
MEESTNAVVETAETTETQDPKAEKTFTQAELDRIVQERVKEMNEYKAKAAKYDEMEEANKSELQKAQDKAAKLEKELNELKHGNEIRDIRSKVSGEKGVPVDLLTGETEEACIQQAEAILKFAQNNTSFSYVPDGGEVKTTAKKTTANQFADWMQKNIK